ncbi:MAG TPA: hypothetical protein PKI11_00625, partial [Candidatus Hydrogenedentes bacterium]|nr:hypothetical protein [Candidatus Hydrogenedentota bacterium]
MTIPLDGLTYRFTPGNRRIVTHDTGIVKTRGRGCAWLAGHGFSFVARGLGRRGVRESVQFHADRDLQDLAHLPDEVEGHLLADV